MWFALVGIVFDSRQLKTLRVSQTMIATRYMNPFFAGTKVISVHQTRLGQSICRGCGQKLGLFLRHKAEAFTVLDWASATKGDLDACFVIPTDVGVNLVNKLGHGEDRRTQSSGVRRSLHMRHCPANSPFVTSNERALLHRYVPASQASDSGLRDRCGL